MKTTLNRETLRRLALITLAAAAAAGVVKGRERPALEPLEPRAGRIDARSQAADATELDLASLLRPQGAARQGDPFAPRDFAPPAPKLAAAPRPAPAASEVPPLPFAYFGRLTQDGRTEVFVMRGDELISIAPGRRIDAEYQVDSISEQAIRFMYLPLNTLQSLDLQSEG